MADKISFAETFFIAVFRSLERTVISNFQIRNFRNSMQIVLVWQKEMVYARMYENKTTIRFLVKIPYNLACLGMNKGDSLLENYAYER